MKYLNVSRKPVNWIVIHTAECPRLPGKARVVAHWLDSQDKSSAHYIVDSSEVISCVPEECVAWHAPKANLTSIGVEIVGYAKDPWSDDESLKTLDRVIDLVAGICTRWDILPVWLDAINLKRGMRGITGHQEITDALNDGRGHWDPGPKFPRKWFAEQVAMALGQGPKAA